MKTTGDGMLVEFASVVDGARSSAEIERGMAERNASVPAEKRIEFGGIESFARDRQRHMRT
jgi:adenylate cyclase